MWQITGRQSRHLRLPNMTHEVSFNQRSFAHTILQGGQSLLKGKVVQEIYDVMIYCYQLCECSAYQLTSANEVAYSFLKNKFPSSFASLRTIIPAPPVLILSFPLPLPVSDFDLFMPSPYPSVKLNQQLYSSLTLNT